MATHTLVVEPHHNVRSTLAAMAAEFGEVDSEPGFETARPRLALTPYDFLVTNVRLGGYNGLHLVYLASWGSDPPRRIVYGDHHDPVLAREVQLAGAFYETRECLSVTLTAYLAHTLPPLDRRAPSAPDRRRLIRGGRRCWDRHRVGRHEALNGSRSRISGPFL